MKSKILWLVLGCITATVLVLLSCAPAAPVPTPTPTPTPTPAPAPKETAPPREKKEMVRDSLGRSVEKPKYGGLFTHVLGTDTRSFDEAFSSPWLVPNLHMTNEELSEGDWAKGPSGSGEISFSSYGFPGLPLSRACLAESWEVPDPRTIVFHIRKGVRFHDKPPTAGREMTADDVLFSIKRVFELRTAYIGMAETHPESVTAPDKYTVVVKGPAGEMIEPILDGIRIVPRDMVEKYGNMRDWRNSCGTGPFILVDYVSGSSISYVRNPNYWGKDPLHPGNTLPYVDRVKSLIITDASTRLAALRTAKVERLSGISWEDKTSLDRTTPALKWTRELGTAPYMIYMRQDKPELPFYDIRVRRALAIAIDCKKIANEFYGGHAEILSYPIVPLAEFMYAYTPLDKLPESVRELWEYHPDKAKQLLAEAGYPKGFKTEIVCYAPQVDILSIIKSYWAAIGIELKLDVKEYGVYDSIQSLRTHKEMLYRYGGLANPARIHYARAGGPQNASIIVDEYIEESVKYLGANYFDEAKKRQRIKEVTLYSLEKCWLIQPPHPYNYVAWWPWVKGYSGETNVGYWNSCNFPKWLWVDQELKEEMMGKR